MADFSRADLRGSRFDRVDLSGAQLRAVDLRGAQFRGVELSGAMMRGVMLVGVDIHGEIEDLTINGVDIGPLIDAELNRRYPDRAKMRPADPAGFREAWGLLERLWGETVERARRLRPELLHESVDGEWSFIQTLRHLVFATDAWIRLAILGDPSPWDPLDLPWDEMPDTPGVPRDRDARPSLDTVLELRRDRMFTVRRVIEGLTDESLDGHTQPVEGPGWPEPSSYPVRECLLCILNEEWEHRLYAERDLDVLIAHSALARRSLVSGPAARVVRLASTDERFLRAHDAELVSLGVGQDRPGLGAGLPDVGPARPEREQAVDLLVAVGGAAGEVKMHAVLDRLGIGHGHEADADGRILVGPDDDLALALGQDLPAQRLRPEPGQAGQVVSINDDVVKSEGHADSMRGAAGVIRPSPVALPCRRRRWSRRAAPAAPAGSGVRRHRRGCAAVRAESPGSKCLARTAGHTGSPPRPHAAPHARARRWRP